MSGMNSDRANWDKSGHEPLHAAGTAEDEADTMLGDAGATDIGRNTSRRAPAATDRARYYAEAGSWAEDRDWAAARQLRLAWVAASVAAAVGICEAIAIVALMPLKTVVPYTLLVDRQTGYVEVLKPLERATISPDQALTRSFLAQYVIARESFDITSLQSDYRKVALWSAGEARDRYVAGMQASNPASPLATLPRLAVVSVQIRSVSSLSADTALIRFSTTRSDPGGQPAPPQYWAAVLSWKFLGVEMSADDRLINPLGFQVTRYRRDAETAPDSQPAPVAAVAVGVPRVMTGVPAIAGAAVPVRVVPPGTPVRVITPGASRP